MSLRRRRLWKCQKSLFIPQSIEDTRYAPESTENADIPMIATRFGATAGCSPASSPSPLLRRAAAANAHSEKAAMVERIWK